MSPATLPPAIEIFKPGRHTDMAGQVHEFSTADVHRMAAAYDRAEREAPLCVGHPADNRPAYGYVKGLAVNAAGRLTMDTHQVAPAFAELVRAGRYKKRSASFYAPNHPGNPAPGAWYLRHVAFLGAQPPAIAGLADIAFADDGTGLVEFAELDMSAVDPAAPTPQPTLQREPRPCDPSAISPAPFPVSSTPTKEIPDMPDPIADKLAELEQKLKAAADETAAAKAQLATATAERDAAVAQNASFAEQAKAERLATFTAFAEAQIKAGSLLPKDKVLATTALEVLADAQPVEFAQGDATRKVQLAAWLQGLIAGARPSVSFGEFRPRSAPGSAPGGAPLPGSAQGMSDADIDRAARQYAAHKQVSYADALAAVVSFAD